MKKPAIDPVDYFEILELYSAYNQCSDAGDVEGYADCFTADGVLDGGRYIKGREALLAFKRQEAGARRELYRRHWNGSLRLSRGEGESIVGACYLLAYIGIPGHLPVVTHSGVYTDTIVKEQGRWLFALRKLTYDGNSTAKPAIPAAVPDIRS